MEEFEQHFPAGMKCNKVLEIPELRKSLQILL